MPNLRDHKAMINGSTILKCFAFLALLISCTEKDGSIPSVRTNEADSITNTSAVITGVVSTSGATRIVALGACWDTTQNLTLVLPTKSISFNSTNEIYYKINGLVPNTEYYSLCYASSDWGIGYGNIVKFTTRNQTPDSGYTYLDNSDYFVLNFDTCNLGTRVGDNPPVIMWGPRASYLNTWTWEISVLASTSCPIFLPYIVFNISFSGLKPPIAGTFDLQPDFVNLDGSHAHITGDFSVPYGQVEVDVVNGQVSVTFNDIEAIRSGLVYRLSGHFTCH